MDKWEKIATSNEFKALERSKARFIWPIVVVFILFYLSLPLMAGYVKPLMNTFVVGNITFGYAFATSQFFVAWLLAFLYVARAKRFDAQAEDIRQKYDGEGV
ncbi:DUF485 domain-containing protein [Numidum massiliense]|uniref:DUF485 domain-containing protein n=1 Tax=Numidum massiliense TaxID=1522315 RepID=UPI0006D5898C|nr:DUF485 domain-containing protein [Numidum massiliense]